MYHPMRTKGHLSALRGMLVIADRLSWPVADLRIDWTEDCPIAALEAAWAVYAPQMAAYVQRAEDPTAAPSYGVPGDEG